MDKYNTYLKKRNVVLDRAQRHLLDLLVSREKALAAYQKKRRGFAWLKSYRKPDIQGLYVWGRVGRGKTFLMDLFFLKSNIKRKQRWHFQRLMREVHGMLFDYAGQEDPLKKIARTMAKQYDLICIDELYIDDIGDAMLVGQLLRHLYSHGTVTIMTSNAHPDHLYAKGIKRALFLPFIAMIKKNHLIVSLDGDKDYRRVAQPQSQVFFFGDHGETDKAMADHYQQLTDQTHYQAGSIQLNGRSFDTMACHAGVVWFAFHELCEKARGQNDYIAIAEQFNTVLISRIPQLDDGHAQPGREAMFRTNRTRRFISLIDECYDRAVKLSASFDVPLDALYLGKPLQPYFERTFSRLIEMQSDAYLSSVHRP